MGSEVLLSILDSVQIKEEPQETSEPLQPAFSDDPLAVDFSPLVKVEIPDNPLILKEEDVLSHVHVPGHPGTETLAIGPQRPPPPLYQLKTVPRGPRKILPLSPSSAAARKRSSIEVEDHDKFKRLKKVKLERERRVVLKELFEDLDYWVGLGLDERSRRQQVKYAYHDKILHAIGCIDKLERSLSSKAQVYERLLIYNRQLKTKLGTGPVVRTDRNYIYRCEECHRQGRHVEGLRDARTAFTHQDRHHPIVGAKTSKTSTRSWLQVGRVTRQPSKAPSEDSVHLLKCRHCPTTTFDSSVLQVHSLLHKDLVLFQCPWPHCTQLFGVPSKLKRHHFLDHEMVLSSEENCLVNMRSRVNITRKMLRILGGNPLNHNFNPEYMKTLDNFLEANMDAQLIQDEIKIDSELEKVPDKDLECLLKDFLKYTKE